MAERTGTSAPTIRYYQEIGLLRAAPRQAGNQRVYGRDDVERLTFVRRCRCDAHRAGGPGPDCVILGDLAFAVAAALEIVFGEAAKPKGKC